MQDAIQGKLTAKWRETVARDLSREKDGMNATLLLKKTKTEKQQLIKQGKLKVKKLLPPIYD